MSPTTATAIAHPNIALIKYWGDIDSVLHLPANGSISINLAELFTRTSVRFEQDLSYDQFTLNNQPADSLSTQRVSKFLDQVRQMAGIEPYAIVESQNNFPTGTGIASSASGFAALSLAASSAAGLKLDEKALSRLARLGSGSACRSIPGGFVEWQAGTNDDDSYAYTIAPETQWDLVDCIAVVSQEEKTVSSSRGHCLAATSLYQPARVADTPRRLEFCRNAIRMRDFDVLAAVVELDSNLMHAVMMTSTPPLFYWQPTTLTIMQEVQSMRKAGIQVCYTIDAGPNVHVLCTGDVAEQVEDRMRKVAGVYQVLKAHPGGPAKLE